MNARLSLFTFLIITLAVTPVIAQPVFRVHTDKAVNLTKTYTTYYFGSGIYIKTYWTSSVRITKFFEDDLAGLDWFNYTIPIASPQDIYNSAITANCLYVNDVNYSEGDIHGNVYWTNNLGLVHVLVTSGVSFPANISIAYELPPPAETVAIAVLGYYYNATSGITQDVTGAQITVELADSGNATTFDLPAMFSILKDTTYTFTALNSEEWTFSEWIPFGNESSSYRESFSSDQALAVFYTHNEPYNILPVPIIFIFGMVGLGCMFVGPIYGINKFKQKEYRQGFIWATIITALGFALFIAWLFGGSF